MVVLHLAPGHESTMPELLQRHTAMPVRSAENEEKLTPDTVYVIPPGKHLTVSDGRLRLTELQLERGRRVVVDLLFRSLADSHGPHATVIVLSGADGDGSIGLKRIKERGGLTIAQDPEEAEHSSMPGSAIATGMVDRVLKVADMPPRIEADLARATRLRVPSEEGRSRRLRPSRRSCGRCLPCCVRAPGAISPTTNARPSCGAFPAGCR